ncbi:enah/Vasp-like b isoform X1 [Nothobranchius furzeri]|uniref:Ena/VASP-like protein n=2 Tax=Nothobranchius furzeri TaxID=105023 RepID=A0A8C6NRZ8_NOTFU|nr:enah/Vasp-like b isoform X1 [Nothobranchius furzeri]KAF7231290.1 transcript variant X1 [Nothobranchius furzeri]
MDINLQSHRFYFPQIYCAEPGVQPQLAEFKVSEQSICQARASVMVYDDTSKKWVPIKPGQQGFSRINIYHNTANNTFRVVGVKLQDQQVVINYSIVKGLKYNQATPTFHQWRDARQVYGLNFASKEEATTFSNAMLFALSILSAQDGGPALQRQVQNGPTSDEIEAHRARQMIEQQQQMQAHMERERRSSNSGSPFQGHPAVLSVAPPVVPPPMNMGGPPPPPPPPGPPPSTAGAPQPHLPPPLPLGGSSQGDEAPAPTGLAAMIAGAKLRRVQRPEESSSVAKNDANRTSGGSGGLMEEMNALLARRRKAASEKPEDSQNDDPNSPSPSTRSGQNSADGVKKPWDRANSADRSMVSRVRNAGSGGDTDSLDMDRMKQEILDEVFRELHKVKDEIIDALRLELSRVSTT